jgi:hypothetical protein
MSKSNDTPNDLEKQETSKPRDSVAVKFYSPELAESLRQLAEFAEELSGPITKGASLRPRLRSGTQATDRESRGDDRSWRSGRLGEELNMARTSDSRQGSMATMRWASAVI